MKDYVKVSITNCGSQKIWIILNKGMPLSQTQTCDYNESILSDGVQDTLPQHMTCWHIDYFKMKEFEKEYVQ